jgi:ketosteroid isomerase-like protein
VSAVPATSAAAAPEDALESFLDAVERGDHRSLSDLLCRDVCFLTQDSTAIRGRDRVLSLLTQLIAAGVDVRSISSHTLQIADFALVSASWRLGRERPPTALRQTTAASLVLSLREGTWKLLLLAPWGWP